MGEEREEEKKEKKKIRGEMSRHLASPGFTVC